MIHNTSKYLFSWNRVSVILAAIIISIILLPSIQVFFGYSYFKIIVFLGLLWVIAIKLEHKKLLAGVIKVRRKEFRKYFLWIFIVIIYSVLYPQTDLNETMGSPIKLIYSFTQISLCYIIASAYSLEKNRRVHYNLMKFLLIALGINAWWAIPSLFTGQLTGREYVNVYQQIETQISGLSVLGLGDLGLYCAHAILTPFFLLLTFKAKGITSAFFFVSLAGVIINTLLSSLLAPILVMIFGMVMYFLMGIKKSRLLNMRVISIIYVVFLISVLLIGTYAVTYNIDRVMYFLNSDTYKTVEGYTFYKREMLYTRSIETFLAFPFIGAGGRHLISPLSNWVGIGGHSGILDAFAMYGLLFLVYISFLKLKYYHLKANIKYYPRDLWSLASLIAFKSFIILIILDPLLYNSKTTGVFLFFIVGYTIPNIYKKDKWFRQNKFKTIANPLKS